MPLPKDTPTRDSKGRRENRQVLPAGGRRQPIPRRVAQRLARLEQKFLESAVAFEDLQKKTVQLQDKVLDLLTQLAAIRASTSWKITWPGRAIASLLRRTWLYRLIRSRTHRMILRSPSLILASGDHNYSLGARSEFALFSSKSEHPSGWCVIHLRSERSWSQLIPSLRVETRDLSTSLEIPLERPTSIRSVEVVRLPESVTRLSLLLRSREGRFSIDELTIRECGSLEVALRSAWARLRRPARRVAPPRAAPSQGVEAGPHPPSSHGGRGDSYSDWIALYDRLDIQTRHWISARIPGLEYRPLISILLPLRKNLDGGLDSTLKSFRAQLYPKWELLLIPDLRDPRDSRGRTAGPDSLDPRLRKFASISTADSGDTLSSAIRQASGEWVAILSPGDRLAEHALYCLVEELNRDPDVDVLYSDEDEIDESGTRSHPFFKPDWSPDLLYSANYLEGLTVYRSSLLRKLGKLHEDCAEYDLALRVTGSVSPQRIKHLPWVLCHRPGQPEPSGEDSLEQCSRPDSERRVLESYFSARGAPAKVESDQKQGWRVAFQVPEPSPLVSVIVPTRDQVELLKNCIGGLLRRTDYADLELLVMDNESSESATLRYFKEISRDHRVRVVPFPHPFDFAAINNRAAEIANGQVLAFLNNDVEVMSPNWLKELVSHALRPEVGAVGPLLYYPSLKVQHAGIVLGSGGVAALRHRGRCPSATAYDRMAMVTRNVSAVTAACMVLRREVFEEAGCFDSGNLRVAFNDVDLCLRIRELGYWLVWSPHAALKHHESKSLNRHDAPERASEFGREVLLMKVRWGPLLGADPFYNPNLSLELGRDYQVAFPPRASKPWEI